MASSPSITGCARVAQHRGETRLRASEKIHYFLFLEAAKKRVSSMILSRFEVMSFEAVSRSPFCHRPHQKMCAHESPFRIARACVATRPRAMRLLPELEMTRSQHFAFWRQTFGYKKLEAGCLKNMQARNPNNLSQKESACSGENRF